MANDEFAIFELANTSITLAFNGYLASACIMPAHIKFNLQMLKVINIINEQFQFKNSQFPKTDFHIFLKNNNHS
ncbi:MAG TPA: hypothetical protein PLJ70_09990, partial [Methylotenera sp.]|nr:hypothetical protein [Methylotenera sp.]